MRQDFFTYFPLEIIVNILLRLPIRSIIQCKRVCKSWLDFLVTPEFAMSHISKSVPGLAVFKRNPQIKPYKILEFVDPNFNEHRWNAVLNFNLPFHGQVHSSANGLLFWSEPDFLICNPITRDYIMLPSPLETSSVLLESCGFGVSRISGQYKVVGMFFNKKLSQSECQVYSVGTGSWRKISSAGVPDCFQEYGKGAFVNGNLHWLARAWDSLENPILISCFDLETELFSTSSPPPRDGLHRFRTMSVLRGCLCLCDNLGRLCPYEYNDIIIWLMKEYGDEKSWTKEFVIHPMMIHVAFVGFLRPIKVFEDGNILMEIGRRRLVYYSNKTKTIREVDVFGSDCAAISYTLSFLSLKTIAMENVLSF